MAKLTLQEQLLKAGSVTSKKAAEVERVAKKSRVQAYETRAAVEKNKKVQPRHDKQLSEQQKQAALAEECKIQVRQFIEVNRITIAYSDIGFNFTDGNLIRKIFVGKLTQVQLINGRLVIARSLVDSSGEGGYTIIPASVADKIAQRDISSIVLYSALSAEEQDENDPYADFKVPDDLMWQIQMSRTPCLMQRFACLIRPMVCGRSVGRIRRSRRIRQLCTVINAYSVY